MAVCDEAPFLPNQRHFIMMDHHYELHTLRGGVWKKKKLVACVAASIYQVSFFYLYTEYMLDEVLSIKVELNRQQEILHSG